MGIQNPMAAACGYGQRYRSSTEKARAQFCPKNTKHTMTRAGEGQGKLVGIKQIRELNSCPNHGVRLLQSWSRCDTTHKLPTCQHWNRNTVGAMLPSLTQKG